MVRVERRRSILNPYFLLCRRGAISAGRSPAIRGNVLKYTTAVRSRKASAPPGPTRKKSDMEASCDDVETTARAMLKKLPIRQGVEKFHQAGAGALRKVELPVDEFRALILQSRMQRTRCPPPTSRSEGISEAQAGEAKGQRVRKRQPEGGATSEGISPFA